MPAAWVVIVIIFWIISNVQKAKKKQESQQAQHQPIKVGAPTLEPRQKIPQEPKKEEQKADLKPAVPKAEPRLEQMGLPLEAVHYAKPLEAHMHTPEMGLEGDGTEGIDCCHDYMLGEPGTNEPADFLPLQEGEEAARAKALLQGVIFSEVLGRRPVKHYGRS